MMEMAMIMLARLELEKRVEADQKEANTHVLEPLLTRCWGCYDKLQTGQEVEAGHLCKRCQRRRQWERN
jgi:hypothetical protein